MDVLNEVLPIILYFLGAVLLIVIITIMILVLPKFKLVQKLTDNLNRITRENLTGVRVIRAFNAESYQNKKFNNSNKEFYIDNLSFENHF